MIAFSARRLGRFLPVAAAVVLAACDELPTDSEPWPASLEVSAPMLEILDGRTTDLKATLFDASGKPIQPIAARYAFNWSVADSSVARVNASGDAATVSGTGVGTTWVIVTAEQVWSPGKSGNTNSNGNGGANNSGGQQLRQTVKVTSHKRATALRIVDGNEQRAQVNTQLPTPLVVEVVDNQKSPIEGIAVRFEVASDGGKLSSSSVTTDAAGTARVSWTLPTVAGKHHMEASVDEMAPVRFSAEALHAEAAAAALASGGGQHGVVNSALAAPVVVRVSDTYGNPVPGTAVAWSVTSGGGSIRATSATTGADGTAAATWTLGGTVGTQRAVAAASGRNVPIEATAHPSVASVKITSATTQFTQLGQSSRFVAEARSSSGALLPDARFTWTSRNNAIVAAAEDGTMTARGIGTVFIIAAVAGIADSVAVTVQQASSGTVTGTIPLQLVRVKSGSGNFVSAGVPLPPGRLQAGDVNRVSLFVNGAEQSIYVEPLSGRHRDGSLRSILVQLSYPVGGTPIAAELRLGSTRGMPDRSKTSPSYTYANPAPDAALLPASADYLVSTGIAGPTQRAPAPFNSAYESNFITQSDGRWTIFQQAYGGSLTADDAIGANYYDRALFHWAWWVRTANPEYWRRANLYLMAWRELYARRHDYRLQPHHMQLEGIEVHYLLTGDAESLRGVSETAINWHHWLNSGYITNKGLTEGRIQSRVLQGFISAHRLNAPSSGRNWQSLARQTLDGILSTQSADGSWRFDVTCGHQLNYMTALVLEVMTYYHDHVEADSRIVPAMQKAAAFLWNSQWLAGDGAFKYVSGGCGGVGGQEPAPDLNLLFVQPWGWLYQKTGNATYRSQGDTIFNEGVRRAWFGSNFLQAQKQFNENYRSSYQYLRLRQ